jgi:amino acid transporter
VTHTTHSSNSKLRRNIALIGAILLTLSAITPASSMFIIIPGVIKQAGTGVIFSLAIAALIGLIMCFVYGELASAFPSAGGEYVMVAKTLGLFPSYITLILNASVMTLISSVLAVGASDYFVALLPEAPPTMVAIVIIMLATVFGILSIRLNAWVTGVFLTIELILIFYIGIISAVNIQQPLSILLSPNISLNGTIQETSLSSILIATATAVFAFNGYEQAVYLTEEIQKVRRNIANVIILSLLITLCLEFSSGINVIGVG